MKAHSCVRALDACVLSLPQDSLELPRASYCAIAVVSKNSSSESDSSVEHLCRSRRELDHQNISIEIIFMSSDDLVESRFLGDCWSAIRQSAPPSPIRRIQKVCFMISWFDKTFPVARGVYFALSSLGALLRSGSRVCPRSRFEAFGWRFELNNHAGNLYLVYRINFFSGAPCESQAQLRQIEGTKCGTCDPVFACLRPVFCTEYCGTAARKTVVQSR